MGTVEEGESMAGIYNGRYALIAPGSGLTVVSLEDGELNMFGSCTRISTTQWESYPEIEDEPSVLHAGDSIKEKLHTGLAEATALAGVAVAARVTERAALEPYVCALGGVASLMTAGGTGYMAGAAVYGITAAVPAASLLAGTKAGRMPVAPDIAAGCMLDICSDSSGYKTLLDKLFHKDTDASETVGMALAAFVEDYPGLAESDMDQRDKKGGSDEEGLFLEPGSDPYEDEKKNRKEGREYKRFNGGGHIGLNKWRDRIFDADGENQDSDGLGSAGGDAVSNAGSTAGWYSDIAAGTAKGSATNEIFVLSTRSTDKEKFPDIYVYDGLPWEPDSNTYFFDLRKAREDIWPLYEKAGASKDILSPMLVSSPVDTKYSEVAYKGQYSAIIDGIPALGVGVWPSMWKNYYPEYAMKTIAMDGIDANWTYKIAIVVVDKGEEDSDSSKWKYVPATRISAKAHTFYGGVLQTNVTLTNKGGIQTTASDSGHSGNTTVGYVSSYGSDEASVVQMLKDIMAVNGRLGDWWLHYVETYNIESNMSRINVNYDFAGYVIYGDTFMNMS